MIRLTSVVLALVLVAGCFGGEPERSPSPTTPPEGEDQPGPYLALEECSEINLLVPRAETPELPPFMSTTRTANLVATGLITILSCEQGRTRQATIDAPAAYTYLFPVEELAYLTLPGAAGYLFLTEVRAEDRGFAASFGPWAPTEVVLSLSVEFADVGSMPDARATATVLSASGNSGYSSVMIQPATPGSGGFLGMYTVNETHVHLHNVTFGDYLGYQQGTGAISNPRPHEQGAVQAYHNVGYDVRFDFGVDEAIRPR